MPAAHNYARQSRLRYGPTKSRAIQQLYKNILLVFQLYCNCAKPCNTTLQ